MQPRSAAPHPDQGKTGSRAGARHRRRSPRTAQHDPAWIPSFLRLTLARTAVSIPTRPERGQPRPCRPPALRDTGGTGRTRGSQGVQRVVPGPRPVVRRPFWGQQDVLFLRAPQLPAAVPVVEQPLPCSPQMEQRWLEAAWARSQRRGQGCLPPSLLPSPQLSLPFSLGPQPFLPALTSPPEGCPGPAAAGGYAAICRFLGWYSSSGGRASLPRWRLLSISKLETPCLSPPASEKGNAGPLKWKLLHGSSSEERGLAARSRGWQGRKNSWFLGIISVAASQSPVE